MAQHVKVLGVLHIVLGCFGILGAIVVFFILGGVSGFIRMNPEADHDAALASTIIGIVAVAVPGFIVLLSSIGIVIGLGLMQFRPWAKIWGIVLSALDLLHIPFGTALGVYGLWVLLKPETDALFRPQAYYVQGYQPPPPVRPT